MSGIVVRFPPLVFAVLLSQHVHSAEQNPVYKYGTEYYSTMEQAEAAMRASVAGGGDLIFKWMIPITGGKERYVYHFPKKQFERLPGELYAYGTLFSHYPKYADEPIKISDWNNSACSQAAKETFRYSDAVKKYSVSTIANTVGATFPIPGHREYVNEEHAYSYEQFSFEQPCIPKGTFYKGTVLKIIPIQCPVGYKPRTVTYHSPTAPFPDVCDSITGGDYSIYKETAVCPWEPLTPIEQLTPNDATSLAKTRALERGESAYDLLSNEMKTAEQCLATKFAAKGACYKLESDYRSEAYQKHLREIYDKWFALVKASSKQKIACSETKKVIDLEMGGISGVHKVPPCNLTGARNHCVKYGPPAVADPKHTQGDAVDVKEACVNELKAALVTEQETTTIKQYLEQEPTCDAEWGGDFSKPDPVHFKYKAPPQPDPIVN